MLVAIGFGALRFLHRDLATSIQKWFQYWHVDPDSHFFRTVIGKATGIKSNKIALASVGSFFYATLFLIEGIGLLMLKRWAEIFTVIVTASFIPLEVYHLVKHFSAMKIVVILINAAIVVFLVWRLKHDKSEAHR